MTLTPTARPILNACAPTGLNFSSHAAATATADDATFNADAPSAKLNINISAFNGNTTNFGKK